MDGGVGVGVGREESSFEENQLRHREKGKGMDESRESKAPAVLEISFYCSDSGASTGKFLCPAIFHCEIQ